MLKKHTLKKIYRQIYSNTTEAEGNNNCIINYAFFFLWLLFISSHIWKYSVLYKIYIIKDRLQKKISHFTKKKKKNNVCEVGFKREKKSKLM